VVSLTPWPLYPAGKKAPGTHWIWNYLPKSYQIWYLYNIFIAQHMAL